MKNLNNFIPLSYIHNAPLVFRNTIWGDFVFEQGAFRLLSHDGQHVSVENEIYVSPSFFKSKIYILYGYTGIVYTELDVDAFDIISCIANECFYAIENNDYDRFYYNLKKQSVLTNMRYMLDNVIDEHIVFSPIAGITYVMFKKENNDLLRIYRYG